MLRQYQGIKERYADAIILFRLGDFFEMFYEDAKVASGLLGLTLTGRGQGANRVPMCGFPHRAAAGYVAKLLAAGYKVAVAEQTEDPSLAKDLVRRDVVRVITPGTVWEDELLPTQETRYVAAVACKKGRWAGARLDFSTGEFEVWPEIPGDALGDVAAGWGAAELLVEEGLILPEGVSPGGVATTRRPAQDFDEKENAELIKTHLDVATLAAFGLEDAPAAVAAAGALLRYAAATQFTLPQHVVTIKCRTLGDRLQLDPTTIRNLEIFEHIGDAGRGGTLFALLNKTQTAMGARLLKRYLAEPLLDLETIRKRHEAVGELLRDAEMRSRLRDLLHACSDLERLAGRVALGTATPRDVFLLGSGLKIIPVLREALANAKSSVLLQLRDKLVNVEDLAQLITEALVDDPPATTAEGGFIRHGFRAELDDLRDRSAQAKTYIASLEKVERERTGISSLKVAFNRVFGYYIEVTKPNLDKVPADYIRKQTLVNCERFITPALKEYEEVALSADEKIAALEKEVFKELCGNLAGHMRRLRTVAEAVAALDVLAAFAQTALENDFVRPEMVAEPVYDIEDGRHPVVERFFLTEPFVPNDLKMDEREYFMILTGPNMAGKSTFLRQTALISIMAQAGCFVPARRAKLGLVDRIFTRIGAADDLSRGRSTFLVEMTETAAIVAGASNRSLILLDEVGRGTSTYDGVSLAWAIAEYLARNVRARTLFATHYHELTALSESGNGIVNYKVTVREAGGRVHFLRRVTRGVSSRSYGIQVARLAGLPPVILARAREILEELEAGRIPRAIPAPSPQKRLFSENRAALEEFVAALDPDKMTPKEALETIYKLKTILQNGGDAI